jgi:hypothetical protein
MPYIARLSLRLPMITAVRKLSRSGRNIRASISNSDTGMNNLDLNRDADRDDLESQWHRAREATTAARSHYQGVVERLKTAANLFETARERLEILEILEARKLAAVRAHRPESARPAETA